MNRIWLSTLCWCVGLALPAHAALQFTDVTGTPPLANITTGLNAAGFDANDGFVAVGDNSVVLRGTFVANSTTGLSWVSNGVPVASLSLKAVSQGAGRWVAGGDAASVFFSTDGGATWTATPTKPFTALAKVQGLAFNPNVERFAAVASVLNISHAPATLSGWTAATTPNSVLIESFRGVTALTGTGFAACGLRGDIRISQDSGATWNVSRPFNGNEPDLFGIATGNGLIMTVGSAGRVMTSSDAGANWSTNASMAPIGTINNAVTFAGNEFLVVGDGGRILTGTNATPGEWTTNATVGANLRGVTFATSGLLNGVALAVGDNGTVVLGGTRPEAPNSPVHQAICAGAENLPLAVSFTEDATHPAGTQTVDWYAGAAGGVPLLAGNLNFTPTDSLPASPNAPSNYVYYAEQRDLRTGFVSVSRVAVTNTVFPNTVVVSAPLNATNCPGETASFSVAATGFDLAYQWRSNGVNLVESGKYVGATSTTLQVNNVNHDDAVTYSVVVSGFCNNVTNSATLTVLTNVSAVGPVAQSNCPGTTANFSTVAAGTGPFTYQWRANGVNLVESGKYVGVTAAALQVNNVSSSDALTYSVVVSGFCTSVTNNAALTVLTNVSAVGPVTQTNCPGTTANFSTVAAGTGPFTYQWRANGVNLVESGKYVGVTAAALQVNNVNSGDALTYSVVVSGFCTSVTNDAALTVLTNVSAVGPVAQSNCPGTTANFSTVAAGTGPLTYQWRTNGVNLAESGKFVGVTTAALQVNNVSSGDALTYSVVVSGLCTSVTNNATLTVLTNVSAVGPVAQTNCPGTTANFSTVAAGTGPFTYQWRTNGVNLAESSKYVGVTAAALQVNNVNSGDAITYSVVVSGLCTSVTNNATLTVLTNVSAVGPVTQTNCLGTTASFSTVAAGTGPFTYQWRTNGVELSNNSKHSGVTTATLQVSNVSSNDAVTYSVVVGGNCTSVTNSAGLTIAECGQLTINRQGADNVVLQWLGNLALESSTNLSAPIQWLHVANGVIGTNRWTNAIAPPPPNHFFRLNTNSP